ncbi:MAG: PQQ-binding-like beta-propeller repeat protein, partial [Pseudomonadota bacterium]
EIGVKKTKAMDTSLVLDAQVNKQGEQLFARHCRGCHTGFLGSTAPSPQVLKKFPPSSIIHALTTGVMRTQGYPLSGEQRRALAEYITGQKLEKNLINNTSGQCANASPIDASLPEWNGWGASERNQSYQAAGSTINAENVKHLSLAWAFGFKDSYSAWAPPVSFGGRLFVGSQAGLFYALDAKTGCTLWQFSAESGVRAGASVATVVSEQAGAHVTEYHVLFGDLSGNLYSLNAESGELLWKVELEAHPKARVTGTPLLYEDRIYVPMSSWSTVGGEHFQGCCIFRGSLSSVDVKTGKVYWKTYTIPDEPKPLNIVSRDGHDLFGPSGAAIWSPPALDVKRQLIYIGTGNTYTGEAINSDAVLALNISDGHIKWSQQLTPNDVWVPGCKNRHDDRCKLKKGPNFDIGSPPMLVSISSKKDLIIVGQKSGVAYALNPDEKGEIVWRYRAGKGGEAGGIVWGSAADKNYAYFPVSDLTTPNPGGLHAVKLDNGKPVWHKKVNHLMCGSRRYGCNAAQPVGVSVAPGLIFAGALDGGFRAYSSESGEILWEFNSNLEFKTVNNVTANGGSLAGVGPTIVGDMVYVNSGYGTNGGRVGNVLLAFKVVEQKD